MKRNTVSAVGGAIILLFYFLNKITFLFGASFAEGKVTGYEVIGRRITIHYPIVRFDSPKGWVTFKAESNLEIPQNGKVPVVYKTSDPAEAYIFTFWGFWAGGLVISVIVFLAWIIFFTSFFSRETVFGFEPGKLRLRIIRPPEEQERPRFSFRRPLRRKNP